MVRASISSRSTRRRSILGRRDQRSRRKGGRKKSKINRKDDEEKKGRWLPIDSRADVAEIAQVDSTGRPNQCKERRDQDKFSVKEENRYFVPYREQKYSSCFLFLLLLPLLAVSLLFFSLSRFAISSHLWWVCVMIDEMEMSLEASRMRLKIGSTLFTRCTVASFISWLWFCRL